MVLMVFALAESCQAQDGNCEKLFSPESRHIGGPSFEATETVLGFLGRREGYFHRNSRQDLFVPKFMIFLRSPNVEIACQPILFR